MVVFKFGPLDFPRIVKYKKEKVEKKEKYQSIEPMNILLIIFLIT